MMVVIYRIIQDPDQTADVFQEALYKVWTYLDRILQHPNPHAYILSICTSSAYDFLRKKEKERIQSIQEGWLCNPEGVSPVETHSRSMELIGIIQKAVTLLPIQQAQAVLLRLFEEESFAGIGAALKCSEVTARSHYSKGLARLRLVLDEMHISLDEVI